MFTDESIYSEIGHIVVKFQNLENAVKKHFAFHTNPNDLGVGSIITSALSFGALCKITMALVDKKEINNKVETIELLKKAQDSEKKRNYFIHTLWLDRIFDSSNPEAIHVEKAKITKGKHKVSTKKIELEELQNFNKSLSQLELEITKKLPKQYLNLLLQSFFEQKSGN